MLINKVDSSKLCKCFTFSAITIGFEQQVYMLGEGSGVTNVRFGKVMNQATELNLTVMIDYDPLPLGLLDGKMSFWFSKIISSQHCKSLVYTP